MNEKAVKDSIFTAFFFGTSQIHRNEPKTAEIQRISKYLYSMDLLYAEYFKLSFFMPIFITPTSIQEVFTAEKSNFNKIPKRKPKDEHEGYQVNKALVKKRIWLLFLMNNVSPNLYFLTISFPLSILDNVAYSCFNSWLTNMRQKQGLKDYLWVAERQANGTIHFHIFICQYLNVRKANSAMKSAITTQYKKELITKQQFESIKNYQGVHLSKDRNGRVQNLRKIAKKNQRKAIINYITKYVTKAEEKNDQQHKHLAWFNSRSFSRLQLSYRIEDEESAIKFITDKNINLDYKFTDIPNRVIYPYSSIPRGNIEFDYYIWRNELRFNGIDYDALVSC